ncbi:MAG TPA: DUF1883 domain-containing protein [Solirubrobacteraceae bacterium]|nr:DUF1883 domain-containing protein [Solirubrobacteraceae bacterium]
MRVEHERSFHFRGGRYRGRPVQIEVPKDDHWFAVLELGTYNGRARATVEVIAASGDAERELVGTVG